MSDTKWVKGMSSPNPNGRPKKENSEQSRIDGWSSAITGIGNAFYDKRLSARQNACYVSYEDAIEMWRGDDIAARAIESVPAECFRKGYEMVIADEGDHEDLKEEVDAEVKRLDVDWAVERAMQFERAYGGAAILLGVDDGLPLDKPLAVDKVKSFDWLTVMEPLEVYPLTYYQDPASPKYGEAETYLLASVVSNMLGVQGLRTPPPSGRTIHETRLVVFPGIRVSRYQHRSGGAGVLWGDSILTRIFDVLRDFNVAWHSTGLLFTDFAQSVFKMKGLTNLVARNEAGLQARMRAVEMSRSVARTVLIDADSEEWTRQTTTVTGLAELLDHLSSRLAAAIDMPLTLLMGQSPKGLGNEGESDVRFYYDRIASIQRRRVVPPVRAIHELVMRGLKKKKKLPKKWDVRFHPLWQMNDKEVAEAKMLMARADQLYIKNGVLYEDEVRLSRFKGDYSFETQIDSKKEAPGPIEPGLPNTSTPMPGSQEARAAAKSGGQVPGAAPQAPAPALQPKKNQHVVAGYVRKNRRPAAEPNAGKDVPQDGKRDRADADGPGERRKFAGFDVVVESPKGSVRKWTDETGRSGETTMTRDYGYLVGAPGNDGDSLDCYLGDDEDAPDVYVVHQSQSGNPDLWDEDKVMVGFPTMDSARQVYNEHVQYPGAYAGLSVFPKEEFAKKYLGMVVVPPDEGVDRADVNLNAPTSTDPNGLQASAQQGQVDPAFMPLQPVPPPPAPQPTVKEPPMPEMPVPNPAYNQQRADYVVRAGSKWHVLSERGESLGSYETREEAVRRLAQVEWFKHHPEEK